MPSCRSRVRRRRSCSRTRWQLHNCSCRDRIASSASRSTSLAASVSLEPVELIEALAHPAHQNNGQSSEEEGPAEDQKDAQFVERQCGRDINVSQRIPAHQEDRLRAGDALRYCRARPRPTRQRRRGQNSEARRWTAERGPKITLADIVPMTANGNRASVPTIAKPAVSLAARRKSTIRSATPMKRNPRPGTEAPAKGKGRGERLKPTNMTSEAIMLMTL